MVKLKRHFHFSVFEIKNKKEKITLKHKKKRKLLVVKILIV